MTEAERIDLDQRIWKAWEDGYKVAKKEATAEHERLQEQLKVEQDRLIDFKNRYLKDHEQMRAKLKAAQEQLKNQDATLISLAKSNSELSQQLRAAQDLNRDLRGYVIAYKGLASLTSDEDIFIQSLINKANHV